VGFIEDENVKVVELYIPTLDMIQEPSRRCDEQIHTRAQPFDLWSETNSAKDCR